MLIVGLKTNDWGRFGQRRGGRDHVKTEASTGTGVSQAWEYKAPLEGRRGQGMILPASLQRKLGHAHTSIVDFWPLEL